jgi:hypothetical protein
MAKLESAKGFQPDFAIVFQHSGLSGQREQRPDSPGKEVESRA